MSQSQMRWQIRFKFWTRVQAEDESVTDYSLAIKKLTVHANFPDFNRWLRDRFVTGLNQKYASVQEKLSNTTGLTFEKAAEVAVNMTMVKENARRFHSPGAPQAALYPVQVLIE